VTFATTDVGPQSAQTVVNLDADHDFLLLLTEYGDHPGSP